MFESFFLLDRDTSACNAYAIKFAIFLVFVNWISQIKSKNNGFKININQIDG